VIVLAALVAGAVLEVPYVAQRKDTCGAAALAMVLDYWGEAVPHDEIAARLLEPALHGIPGSQLERFAEERGLTSIAYRGDLAQVRDFVGKGRPLIVAWGMGKGRYHNVVVVGFDDAKQAVLVNDPALGARQAVKRTDFEKRWAGAGNWTLVVVPKAP
jgi:ABC-type bacteriocin/lantibiotic exporter with double-glycine peptidase domain